MVSCFAPLSHSIAIGVLHSGKWQAIKVVPCGRRTLARVLIVSSPLNCFHELD